jgi:hypothetical protein
VGSFEESPGPAGRRPPDWTDFNESDPGITLLALFAFLALGLLFGRFLARRSRQTRLDERDA